MTTDPIASSSWKLSLVVEEGPRPRDGENERTIRRDFAKGRDVQMEFRRHMGLRPIRYPWPELRLDRPTAERLLAWIDAMERRETAPYARGFLD